MARYGRSSLATVLALGAVLAAGGFAVARSLPPGTVRTIAGGIGGPARATSVGLTPCGVAFGAGSLYVSEGTTIRRVNPVSDWLSNVAGVGTEGFAADGTPALSAQLGGDARAGLVCGVAVDRWGNTIFADWHNSRVRVIAATTGTFYGQRMAAGRIYTIAGDGVGGLAGDGGPAVDAELAGPSEMAFDHSGNLIITDRDGGEIRVVAASTGTYYGQAMTAGDIYRIAGDGKHQGFSGDGGPATSAELAKPRGVAVDQAGNVVFADMLNNRIRVIAAKDGTYYGQAMAAGDIYTIAGQGAGVYNGDGIPAVKATLYGPSRVVMDGVGNLVIADQFQSRVRVVAVRTGSFYGQAMKAGDIYTIAGDGQFGFSGDGGLAVKASLSIPSSVVMDGHGNVVIADGDNDRVRVVAVRTGTFYGLPMKADHIYSVAGTGNPVGFSSGVSVTRAQLPWYLTVKLDHAGNLVLTGDGFGRVLYIPASPGTYWGQSMRAGDIYSIAGNGGTAFSGDGGLATRASTDAVDAITDSAGNLVIADIDNSRIRVVAARTGRYWGLKMLAGHIYTIAGNGVQGSSGLGGPGVKASLAGPISVAVDRAGNLLISEIWANRIVVLARRSGVFYGRSLAANHLYLIAGTGTCFFSGDGGPARRAAICNPNALAEDSAGNLLFSDQGNSRIRVIARRTGMFYGQAMTAGDIYPLAGNGSSSAGANGVLATTTGVAPSGLAVDAAGNVVFAESLWNRIRVVADGTGTFYGVAMTAGDIYTIGGTGIGGFSGDGGPALAAQFMKPDDVAVTKSAELLISDRGRIRTISG